MRPLRLLTALALASVLPSCQGDLHDRDPSSRPSEPPGPIVRLMDGAVAQPTLEHDGASPSPSPGPTPSTPRPDPSDPCGGLDFLGECAGDMARWCSQGGTLQERDCSMFGQGCGWIDGEIGFYCTNNPATPPSTRPLPTPAPAPPTPTGSCGTAIEQEQLGYTNQARVEYGLTPFTCDELMTEAARLHARDMCDRGYFSHTSLDGRSFADRLRDQGVRFGAGGENIAHGQRGAADAHDSWMRSSGHRANILNRDYQRIGIGYAECGGRPYWVQVFAD